MVSYISTDQEKVRFRFEEKSKAFSLSASANNTFDVTHSFFISLNGLLAYVSTHL